MPITTVNTDNLVISLDNLSTGNNYSTLVTNIGRGLAFIFIPKENFTVTQIIFRINATGADYSAQIFTVSIQNIDAEGKPDNINQTSGTWNGPIAPIYINVAEMRTVNVTPYNMVKGVPIYVVFKNNDSNWTGGVNFQISCDTDRRSATKGYTFFSNGVWNRRQSYHSNQICFYSGSKYYGDACFAITPSSISTAKSSPNEIGTTFQLPANHPTLSLKGVQLHVTSALANTVFELRIRNSSGTLLSSVSVDGDFNTAGNTPYFFLSTPVDFVAGAKYYIMITGISGTPPLINTSIQPSGQFMTDIRNGIVANLVEYNGTTFTETTDKNVRGYLMFGAIKYDQTEPPPIYSKPGGFSQF
jgi:hypothetical protein